jgi:hypothetical protein
VRESDRGCFRTRKAFHLSVSSHFSLRVSGMKKKENLLLKFLLSQKKDSRARIYCEKNASRKTGGKREKIFPAHIQLDCRAV